MLSKLFVTGLKLTRGLPEDSYLNHLPVLKALQEMEELPIRKPVTFLIGENGAGKSTLIEAIAVNMGFNPEGGTVNFNFSTTDTHSELYRYLTVVKGVNRPWDGFFLRAESFYNAAAYIDRDPRTLAGFGGVPLHGQSHGESFLALVEHRFKGHGLYLLDEPEAALSPNRLLTLLCHIQRLTEEKSQLIISTHSPILMAFPGAEILQLGEDGIKSVDYKDTEHYQVTKRFLENPERMLKYLLG